MSWRADKGERDSNVMGLKVDGGALLDAVRRVIEALELVEGVQWVVDVDPVDLL